jgi:hypothetical protein
LPAKIISLPTDLSEATGISSVTGNFLSDSTCNILVPTRPVAPTTATFMDPFFILPLEVFLIDNTDNKKAFL